MRCDPDSLRHIFDVVRARTVLSFARHCGYTLLLQAASSDRLAVKALTTVCEGGGIALPAAVSFKETFRGASNKCNTAGGVDTDIHILRPFKDITSKELYMYQYHRYRDAGADISTALKKPFTFLDFLFYGASSYRPAQGPMALVEEFLSSLAGEFNSTIANINSTMNKLDTQFIPHYTAAPPTHPTATAAPSTDEAHPTATAAPSTDEAHPTATAAPPTHPTATDGTPLDVSSIWTTQCGVCWGTACAGDQRYRPEWSARQLQHLSLMAAASGASAVAGSPLSGMCVRCARHASTSYAMAAVLSVLVWSHTNDTLS